MATALIIGGGGFIGGRLARRLARTGRRVTVADIAAPEARIPGVDYRRVDARTLRPGDLHADEDTAIYLLAAVLRTPGHRSHEYFDTNCGGAAKVRAFAEAAGVRRIVFTSSIAVYGPDETMKDENSAPTPTSSYGWSKLLAERELQDWARDDAGRRLVIARPAVVFGPGERGNFTRLAAALRRRLFAYPGRRDTVKSCCFVDDLIDSFDFALRADQPELIYNFAYPDAPSIRRICETLHEVGGVPAPMLTAPRFALDAAARLFEALERVGLRTGVNRARIAKLTCSTHVAPARLMEMGFRFPTDLAGGLRAWRDEAEAFR